MDFGNFLRGFGGFVGGLFGGNKDDEERRRRQQQQQPATVVQPLSYNAQQSNNLNYTNRNIDTPLLGGATAPKPVEFSGLSEYDRNIAQRLKAQGKPYQSFVNAARRDTFAKNQSNTDNSFLGGAANFTGEVAKTLVSPAVGFGENIGSALASFSPQVRSLDKTVQQNRQADEQISRGLSARLNDPNTDAATKQRIRNYYRSPAYQNDNVAQSQASLYEDIQRKTDPLTTALNAAGTALLPFVGGLTGTGAKTAVGTGINAVVDPLSLLEKIPKNSRVGRFLNTELENAFRNRVAKTAEQELGNQAPRPVETQPAPIEQPTRPITVSEPTVKAPAITSNNPNYQPPVMQQVPRLEQAPTIGGTDAVTNATEQLRRAEQGAANPVDNTVKAELEAIQRAIDQQTVQQAPAPEAVTQAPLEQPSVTEARATAPATAPIDPAVVEAVAKQQAAKQAPTDTPPAPEGAVVKPTEGKTYTVYRGSGGEKKVTTQNDLSILGNDKKYYALEESVAKKFGENIEKTDITLKKPAEITNDEQWRAISKAAGNKYPSPVGLSKEETQAWINRVESYLKSQGHDGLVVKFSNNKEIKLIGRIFGDEQVVPFTPAPAKKAPQLNQSEIDNYVRQMASGRMALSDVPEKYRKEVIKQRYEDTNFTPTADGKSRFDKGNNLKEPNPDTPQATPEVPRYKSPVRNNKTASVPGNRDARYTTGDSNLDGIVHDSIVAHKGTAQTAGDRADALDAAGVDARKRARIRDIAVRTVDKENGQISEVGIKQIKNVLLDTNPPVKKPKASKPAPSSGEPKLGTITRQAVIDGSINKPEGIAKAEADTQAAAEREAEAAGTTLEDIIKKGQKAWEKSKSKKRDLTSKEAAEKIKGFTPEQQRIFKAYGQELSTLRDRAGYSLNTGNQGAWYGPRQYLDETGQSMEYDPSLVNEKRRTMMDAGDNELDYSSTPYSQYIRRYANAGEAGAQRVTDAVETKIVEKDGVQTVEPTGLTVPDEAKQTLKETLQSITEKSDEAIRLQDKGDIKGAKSLQKQVQKETDKAFSDFIDEIPGTGADRREAIKNVKAIRGSYMQSTMQTLSLTNLVNRAADQGTRAVYGAQQPLVRGLSKIVSPFMQSRGMQGTVVTPLNTSKEALRASRNFAKGTLMSEIRDNFNANMSLAGAGRGKVLKAAAKVEAFPRAVSSALTQFGDLSTQNVQKALQLGASRPEAQGLKTVKDYEAYFGEYVNTDGFKSDLLKTQSMNNPRIGLAGAAGDNMVSGGKISNFMSREVDNVVRTNAQRLGIKDKRIINEANDYVKGNITGYAGVGSRVFGTIANAASLGIPRIRRAVKIAESGDPAAVANATQVAAQSVADAIAFYGTAGAATVIAANGGDVIGYTGEQPVYGSSNSSFNKANSIPANQWYINLPNGKRVYFDPARPLGGPGVAANLAAGATSGKNLATVTGNSVSQVYNQAGGSSLPDTAYNLKTLADPASREGDKKYAGEQLQSTLAPSTGILNNVANLADNKKRAPKNFVDNIKSNVPGLRSSVPIAKDSLGNEIPNSKQASAGSYLYSVANNPDSAQMMANNPVMSEISRLKKVSSVNVMPTSANTNAPNSMNQPLAKMLLNAQFYKSASNDEKANMLHSVLIGRVKGINKDAKDADKQALLEYSLQGNKRKSWLEDINNAARYYNAAYDNARLNKTITRKDEDLQNKGGLKYKAVVAKLDVENGVTQDLKEMYAKVSASEINQLEDRELAAQLIAYDQLRAKAGVSLAKYTNRPKYSNGSGGSRRSGNFAFVSLPESLMGTKSTVGSGYSKGGRTFKPIADLQARPTVAIPKGRSISIKRGIQL